MEKLFVTRVDSLVGANAAAVLSGRLEVTSSTSDSDPTTTTDAVLRERPDWVLHCGPASWSSWDLAGIDGVRAVATGELAKEAAFLAALADACRQVQAKLTVVTSDALFRGPRMFHDENGASRAVTPTAKQLAGLEKQACEAGALVLRSHVYGWMPNGGATNYAERMFHSLTAELPCRVDARRHATPILATDFANLAFEANRAELRGVYHLAGAERTSPHRVAAELAATLGVPGRNVRLLASDDKSNACRLEETSLNIGAVRQRLSTALPMLREGLSRFVDQGFNGYRDRLKTTTAPAAQHHTTMQAA